MSLLRAQMPQARPHMSSIKPAKTARNVYSRLSHPAIERAIAVKTIAAVDRIITGSRRIALPLALNHSKSCAGKSTAMEKTDTNEVSSMPPGRTSNIRHLLCKAAFIESFLLKEKIIIAVGLRQTVYTL